MSVDANFWTAMGMAVTSLTGFIIAWRSRRKVDSDASKANADASIALVEPLTRRLEHAEFAIEKAEAKIRKLEEQVLELVGANVSLRSNCLALCNQVRGLGGIPCVDFDHFDKDKR